MRCVVLGEAVLCWRLEDLGEEWCCVPAATAAQAWQLLLDQPIRLLVLTACAESGVLLEMLRDQPLLAPPWVLGIDVAAPDGQLPEMAELPARLQAWKLEGRIPALCAHKLPETTALAGGLLHALGVPEGLRAWAFLPDMVGLTAVHPPLMTDLTHALYPLVARRHGMTATAVERSLRLCVESTWNRGRLEALERFFGSSVDPDRGKPTNREFLCRMQERLTLAADRLRR